MNDFFVVNIQDLIQQIGEENVLLLLKDFISLKNPEIENFIRNRALDFVQRKLAVTYIVLDSVGDCAAYFTLVLFGERKSDSDTLYKLLYRFI